MTIPTITTREGWLNEAAELILLFILAPATAIDTACKVKVSVGFTGVKGASNTKALGSCFRKSCSTEGFNEIYISPICDDSLEILGTLAHELIHAIDDCQSGHKGFFAKVARKIGLIGPLTATSAGPALAAKLESFIGLLGPIPHARLDLRDVKKQKNRNILCSCSCGFKFRTAQAQIDLVLAKHEEIICPSCLNPMTVECK
jgi:hypothetical protein